MITVDFSGGHESVKAQGLYQWDKGQKLVINGLGVAAAQVHYANEKSENAIIFIATKQDTGGLLVDIPNSLLEEEYGIYAYIYLTSGTDGETIKTVHIPVKRRQKPEDFISEPDPEQAELIDNLIATYNATVEKCNQTVAEVVETSNQAVADVVFQHNATSVLVDQYREFSDVRVVTQAQYDALATKESGVIYVISDAGNPVKYTHLITDTSGTFSFTLETNIGEDLTGDDGNGSMLIARLLTIKGCTSKDKVYPATGVTIGSDARFANIVYGVYAPEVNGKYNTLKVCFVFQSSSNNLWYRDESTYSSANLIDTVNGV